MDTKLTSWKCWTWMGRAMIVLAERYYTGIELKSKYGDREIYHVGIAYIGGDKSGGLRRFWGLFV